MIHMNPENYFISPIEYDQLIYNAHKIWTSILYKVTHVSNHM